MAKRTRLRETEDEDESPIRAHKGDKVYCIGPALARTKGYTDGPFDTLQEAKDVSGRQGDFIWRVPKGGESEPIRYWDDGDWVPLDPQMMERQGELFRDPEEGTPARRSAPVSNDVDLAWFEAGLRIDRDALDKAFLEQAELLQKASARYAQAISVRDLAKDLVKQVEATLLLRVREKMLTAQEKFTEAILKAKVERHPERVEAVEAFAAATHDAALWEGMFESYKARGYALGELNKLYLAGYFSSSSAKADTYVAGEVARERRREAYRTRSR